MAEDENKLSVTQKKMNLKSQQANKVSSTNDIKRFMGAVIHNTDDGWKTINGDDFARIAYKQLGAGATKRQIQDLEHLFFTSADDVSDRVCYIALPDGRVWDTKKLDFTDEIPAEDCIFKLSLNPTNGNSHREWLEQVALGNKDLANDMMWAIAPVLMYKKPFGVVWFLGNGSNGKSTILKTLYELFGGKKAPFTKLPLTMIEDGRDTPTMNGKLGNICIESHDGHIKDAGNYKHLADHDNFETHKMRTNGNIVIHGNVHTIFNTNNIPTFGDKTKAIRDRTFTIPFNATFPRNQNFDEKLWSTPNFLSDFLGELLATTVKIKNNGYKYNLSALSEIARADYDEEANSAEAYFNDLLSYDICAFSSYAPLYNDYEIWCKDRGAVQLGRKTLASAGKVFGYERKSYRINDKVETRYVLGSLKHDDMVKIPQRHGLFQRVGSDTEIEESANVVDEHYNDLIKLL
jgi:phage/plasmid-associated DNA primase